jgi:hypothetical protein
MDPKTYNRVFKPSAEKYAEIIKANPSVQSVTTIQPQANYQALKGPK